MKIYAKTDQIGDLIEKIENTVNRAATKYLITDGYDKQWIKDYFRTECHEYKQYENAIIVEIRAELGFDKMLDLCQSLDSVIQVKFDRDAYFDLEAPGIASAVITY